MAVVTVFKADGQGRILIAHGVHTGLDYTEIVKDASVDRPGKYQLSVVFMFA
jgi:hypothetical protein